MFWWYLRQPFSDLPSPNRACVFRRTRLSSFREFPVSGYVHYALLDGFLSYHLPPFALCQAFPDSNSYGGSVAISLSAGRRSRLCAHETFSVFRLPVRFLAPFVTGYSSQRAFYRIVLTGVM
jgi:hypothetical protein